METPTISLEQVEAAVRRLPARYLKEVLLFVEFLEYLVNSGVTDDSSEDADLWQAVLAHQAYREAHPEEAPEMFESPEAFLKATADL